ncbi:unnamed protein product [Prorocentrum cordatum]|uniref:Organic hydroperoxide resistance protein n=1 Tax=Prorocentrum cordatum TaxID=2364126 RepID=A0ABN9U098_9DINO|nr:unnamed protein product [Polarella glacialis]|mmetsp:Transcript_93728/g.244141  ORF Transcript_93728/g.244141 Transcript_93728/m.244141 type:complete len:180 (+) Transcript_93728:75-614(+)
MFSPALRRALVQKTTVAPVAARSFAAAPLKKVIFTAHGEADAGTREGNVKSFGEHHGNLSLKLEKHPAHGGKGGGTNPEELFSLGYAACFNGALRLCAEKNGIKIGDSTVQAATSLGVVSEEMTAGVPLRVGLAVKLDVEIAGVDDATAQKCADLAHEFCPYSRATRDNITVEVSAKGK